jgi:Cof subfamily protein (haloacid dehalogenase superfamily)
LAWSVDPSLPRIIATDLDGTLVGDTHKISDRNAKALAQASAAGVQIVLVTGRPVRWLSTVYSDLGAGYPAICDNGAVLYDPDGDRVVDVWPIEPSDLREVFTRLRARVPQVIFSAEVDGGRRMRHEVAWSVREEIPGQTRIATLDELVAAPAVKLMAQAEGYDADAFMALAAGLIGDIVEVTHYSHGGLIEMSRLGVTKATGLAQVAAAYDIAPIDVLAFGDMLNDVSMLAWAGRSVAVANAHPAALAAAGEVTLSNVEDGVAVYLEALLQPAI